MDPITSFETVQLISQELYNKKGSNILALDVRGISSITDYVIIAEGNVERHVGALCDSVVEKLKEADTRPLHTEGLVEGDWAVLDYVHVIVHLFTPQMREKFQLENLWREGKIVDLKLNTCAEPLNS